MSRLVLRKTKLVGRLNSTKGFSSTRIGPFILISASRSLSGPVRITSECRHLVFLSARTPAHTTQIEAPMSYLKRALLRDFGASGVWFHAHSAGSAFARPALRRALSEGLADLVVSQGRL